MTVALLLASSIQVIAGSVKPDIVMFVPPNGSINKDTDRNLEQNHVSLSQGVVVYKFAATEESPDANMRYLNMGWVDRQTQAQCKKHGLRGRGEDFVFAITKQPVRGANGNVKAGEGFIFYNCRLTGAGF